MNPQEALQVLDQATGQAALSRPQHNQVIEALQVVQGAVERDAQAAAAAVEKEAGKKS